MCDASLPAANFQLTTPRSLFETWDICLHIFGFIPSIDANIIRTVRCVSRFLRGVSWCVPEWSGTWTSCSNGCCVVGTPHQTERREYVVTWNNLKVSQFRILVDTFPQGADTNAHDASVTVNLRRLTKITDLTALCQSVALKELSVAHCRAFPIISLLPPVGSTQPWLSELRILGLHQVSAEENSMLAVLKGIPKLHSLTLSRMTSVLNLALIADAAPHLQYLSLPASSLTDAQLKTLTKNLRLVELKLANCSAISDASSVGLDLAGTLLHLDLSETGLINGGLDNLSNCQYLQELSLFGCAQLTDLSFLEGLSSIKRLDICEIKVDGGAEALCTLINLEEIVMSFCSLTDLCFVNKMRNLRRFVGRGLNVQRHQLQNLAGCNSLQELHLSGCQYVACVNSLHTLKNLQVLDVRFCPINNEGITGLAECSALHELNLGFCQLTKINELAPHLENLKKLDLSGTDIDNEGTRDLGKFRSLEELSLADCKKFSDFADVEAAPTLRSLNLRGTNINNYSLRSLKNFHNLQTLLLFGCTNVSDANCLFRDFPSLQSLNLGGTNVDDGGLDMALSSALRFLSLHECESVQHKKPILNCRLRY